MNTPLNDALKPCPFCAKAAEIKYRDESVAIRCVDWAGSCMGASAWHYHEKDAIAAWNTRANTPDSAAQGAMGDDDLYAAFEKARAGSEKPAGILRGIKAIMALQLSDATAQPITDITDERSAFEKWYASDCTTDPECFRIDMDGDYHFPNTNAAWSGWRAKSLLANTAQGKPRNFCADCGKRTPEGSIHTCAPAYAVEQADHIVDANKMVADASPGCSVCYGRGTDVTGKPCPFNCALAAKKG